MRGLKTLHILTCAAAVTLSSACSSLSPAQNQASSTAWRDATQAIVVTSADWNATQAQMQRFERDAGGAWHQMGNAQPVVLGRNGSAWGIGLHPAQTDGPQKKEGDGRNPAGVFAIGDAFGYAANADTRLHYRPMQVGNWCMDVPASPLYNRIVDAREVGEAAVQGSSEPMRLDLRKAGDMRYAQGFVIEHNPRNVPGQGSCIFAHLWGAPTQTTAGCTAMQGDTMQTLYAWLDPAKHPVFVLMPANEYVKRQTAWNLPALEGAR